MMGHRRPLFLFLFGVLVAACSSSKSDAGPGPGAPDGGDALSDGAVRPGQPGPAGTTPPGGIVPPGTIAPGPPRVEYLGRVDTSDAAGPRVGWGGTKIIARFEGTAMSIKVAETEVSDGGSRYDVIIDGKTDAHPFAPTEGMNTYEVVKGLAAGTHVVTLVRRTEPQVGVSQILEITFPNGGKLLAPPQEPARRIEFVGDSEIAGYGIECGGPGESFSAATENAVKTYPEIVGQSLSAESRNLGYSGIGVFRNGYSNGPRYATFYGEAVPRGEAKPWDFGWKPDVVWMALGANDYDLGPNGDRPPPDATAFKDAYRTLLKLVRDKNPAAQIIVVVQAFVNDDYPAGYQSRTNLRTILKALVDERKGGGDTKVTFHELPQATEAELVGCDSHPSAALHTKLAPLVSAKIAEVAGWK